MNFWNNYWYGPVLTLRPNLFFRAFLTLLAFDVWLLRSHLSAAYGLTGFNVAHFSLLDQIQPQPTPQLQGAVQFLTGLMALTLALLGIRRAALGVLSVLYTYGWAMSLLDSFQHHYLMSTILVIMIFFPTDQTRIVEQAGSHKRVTDWPCANCWSYVLLCVTVAIVYIYSAIAKCDAEWISGSTIWEIDKGSGFLTSLASILAHVGISNAMFWPFISVGAIVIEMAIAAAYLVAIVQDRSKSRIVRVVCWTAWALAISLHTGFVLMQLKIGWFSLYMVLLACVVFLPSAVLVRGSYVLLLPFRVFNRLVEWMHGKMLSCHPAVGSTVFLLLAVAILIGLSLGDTIPGISVAGFIAAAILVTVVLELVRRGHSMQALRTTVALLIATAFLWSMISFSSVDFQYHQYAASEWMQVGRTALAQSEIALAERYSNHVGPAELARFKLIAAKVHRSTGQLDEALVNLRFVLSINPNDVEALNSLGAVLSKQGRIDEAMDHFNEVLRVKPDDVNALYNCGSTLVQVNRFGEATTFFQQVLALQPTHADAHNMLGVILARQGRLNEAAKCFEKALEIAPDYIPAYDNMRRTKRLLQQQNE